jgi:hypothetical protein
MNTGIVGSRLKTSWRTALVKADGFKGSASPVQNTTSKPCSRIRVFNAEMPERLRRFMILDILTACRPQAAVDLAPAQRNRAAGTLDLNPSDRSQNKKYRALVRTPRTLVAFLNTWEKMGLGPYGERYCGYSTMEGVKTAIERVRAKAAIPQLSTYSFRHKAATILRRARVPEDQIAVQLGHRRPGLRTTGGYGEWDPSYLREAARALDAWFLKVRALAKTLMKSQDSHKGGEVTAQTVSKAIEITSKNGAGERIRTVDPNLGKCIKGVRSRPRSSRKNCKPL